MNLRATINRMQQLLLALTKKQPSTGVVAIAILSLLAVLFQLGHFFEHILQVGAWLSGYRNSLYMTPVGMWLMEWLGHLLFSSESSARQSLLGFEALHLLGNTIFVGGAAGLFLLLRTNTMRWALRIQLFHFYEHLMLFATAMFINKSIGLSTLFGLPLEPQTLLAYRVWWHFAFNAIPTALVIFSLWRILCPKAQPLKKISLAKIDQRYFQIGFLFLLTLYGALVLHIPQLTLGYVATIFITAQGSQWLFSRSAGIPFDYRSALISTFSISLLLSSQSLLIGVLAATLMTASKFLLRVQNRHIFNPANFAIVTVVFLFPHLASINPGQWGESVLIISLLIVVAGLFVTHTVKRYDIAFFFLIFHALTTTCFIAIGYATWHQLISQLTGIALLLFAFFMITDPKTIPHTTRGRCLYAAFCAVVGGVFQYGYGLTPGFVFALYFGALLLPLIDYVWKDTTFSWRGIKI